MRMRLGLLAAAMLFQGAAAADSTLYRWVDKDGSVHYGDQPAANARQVLPRPLDSPSPPGGSSGGTADSEAARQQAECKRRGEEMARYQSAVTITETDALGNSREYTPEQKDQLLAKTQKYLDEHCGTPPAPSS